MLEYSGYLFVTNSFSFKEPKQERGKKKKLNKNEEKGYF